ncbi:hypothetical protein AJY73_10325 [Campylobacter jejuni]|uniref:hypothetical protein n=1 Tax=Campylobacter jejuni TaxID=197 RepID=UPI000873DA49|nr:hypothetical protein AJY73_10325 [Campylobacter jejuni]
MKKIFIALALILSFVFGAETDDPTSQGQIRQMKNIFGTTDINDNSGTCSYQCLEPIDKEWGVQIIGIDFLSGQTHCKVFKIKDINTTANIDAGKFNSACVDAYSNAVGSNKISADSIVNSGAALNGSNIKETYNQKYSENKVTLARFLAGIVTLDPNIINRDYAADTGTAMLADGKQFYNDTGNIPSLFDNVDSAMFLSKEEMEQVLKNENMSSQTLGNPILMDRKMVTVADDFNKQNIAYYSNLFKDMGIIYNHLQNLLFIVVGGFFMSGLLGKKLQVYLENKGSNPSPNGEAYLHRFFIPLIATAFFFVPIPEGGVSDGGGDYTQTELSATAVQKIIRYFTSEANDIADMASAIGANNYMNKVYRTVGSITPYGESNIKFQLYTSQFIVKQASEVFKNTCYRRYTDLNGNPITPNIAYSNFSSDVQKQDYLNTNFIDYNQLSGTIYDISPQYCVTLASIIQTEKNKQQTYNAQLTTIQNYLNNTDLQTRLKKLDAYIANKELNLGWFNSTILPGTALMVEMQSYIKDFTIEKEAKKQAANSGSSTSISGGFEDIRNQAGGKDPTTEEGAKLTDGLISNALGRVGWLMLPGSSTLMNFINDGLKSGVNIGFGTIGAVTGLNKLDKIFPQGSSAASLLSIVPAQISKGISMFVPATSAILTSYIMEYIVEKIPVLVATVAAGLAFIGYLVALAKYFYISPFVVAFALTTRRVDRIVEFLVTGVTIFFRPILIVLFIYLALFFHSFIKDVFLVFSAEQFGGLKASGSEFMAMVLIELAKGLLKVFAYIASAYVMWKTILGGPDWTFRLMGINNSSSDVITEDVGRRMESKTFMV